MSRVARELSPEQDLYALFDLLRVLGAAASRDYLPALGLSDLDPDDLRPLARRLLDEYEGPSASRNWRDEAPEVAHIVGALEAEIGERPARELAAAARSMLCLTDDVEDAMATWEPLLRDAARGRTMTAPPIAGLAPALAGVLDAEPQTDEAPIWHLIPDDDWEAMHWRIDQRSAGPIAWRARERRRFLALWRVVCMHVEGPAWADLLQWARAEHTSVGHDASALKVAPEWLCLGDSARAGHG